MARSRTRKRTEPRASGTSLTGLHVAKIVSKRTGFRLADTEAILDEMWKVFYSVLKEGDTITVKNVGRLTPIIYGPSLAWDGKVGKYIVSYKGRTLKFEAARHFNPELIEIARKENETTVEALLGETNSRRLQNLLTTVNRRAERGNPIDPMTQPLLQKALEDARKREALQEVKIKEGQSTTSPPEGDDVDEDDLDEDEPD